VFHGLGQAKFADGGSILGTSQFTQLPRCLQKWRSIKKGQNWLENIQLDLN